MDPANEREQADYVVHQLDAWSATSKLKGRCETNLASRILGKVLYPVLGGDDWDGILWIVNDPFP